MHLNVKGIFHSTTSKAAYLRLHPADWHHVVRSDVGVGDRIRATQFLVLRVGGLLLYDPRDLAGTRPGKVRL